MMARQRMSDIAGRLFPASFVGSYPRPSWFDYNLRDRDVVAALREEEFAEAYRDGIRAQIGDQEEAGLETSWPIRISGTTSIRASLLHSVCTTRSASMAPSAASSSTR